MPYSSAISSSKTSSRTSFAINSNNSNNNNNKNNINEKPTNIFYIWYSELCRRLNCNPIQTISKTGTKLSSKSSPTILDFVSDRLKIDDWTPLINALKYDKSLHAITIRSRIERNQFLHDIDNEEKLKSLKRKCGLIWTAYILNSFLKSLTYTIRHNYELRYLEFDGIPMMYEKYLEQLLISLKYNKSIKLLSLQRCKIGDIGCKLLCDYIKLIPNIEILDLSWCCLTKLSGDYISKLIKYQQINRYCESWHNSLRYCDPQQHQMKGLKRLTLNGNQFIGDDGLDFILNELYDDLWIKAIDMQKCGITEKLTKKIIECIEYNQSLEIIDFRYNQKLTFDTIQKILNILKKRQHHNNNNSTTTTEFNWCNTAVTLKCPSNIDTNSNNNLSCSTLHKVKSLPLKQPTSQLLTTGKLRKTKTCDDVAKKNNQNYIKYDEIEEKIRKLNLQLKEEIVKRKESEKINKELQKKIDEINSGTSVNNEYKNLLTKLTMNNVKKKNNITEIFGIYCENGYKINNNNNDTNGSLKCEPSSLFRSIMQKKTESIEILNTTISNNNNINNNNSDDDLSSSQISLCKFMDSLKNNNCKNGF